LEPFELLSRDRDAIVGAAEEALARAHVRHYQAAGADEVRRRLETLYDVVLEALRARDLTGVVGYAEDIAAERFNAGYDLAEVQVAFNVLEEATWSRILAESEPSELAQSLGLVSTILGAGKDALARTYVSLAAGARVPTLDLRALFAGADGP
jgi:hypothetical protein